MDTHAAEVPTDQSEILRIRRLRLGAREAGHEAPSTFLHRRRAHRPRRRRPTRPRRLGAHHHRGRVVRGTRKGTRTAAWEAAELAKAHRLGHLPLRRLRRPDVRGKRVLPLQGAGPRVPVAEAHRRPRTADGSRTARAGRPRPATPARRLGAARGNRGRGSGLRGEAKAVSGGLPRRVHRRCALQGVDGRGNRTARPPHRRARRPHDGPDRRHPDR